MKKLLQFLGLLLALSLFFQLGTVFADREILNRDLIRLHVVANSDSAEDQRIKLRVRDAILDSLRLDMESLPDTAEARAYLEGKLEALEKLANRILREAGSSKTATVTLGVEDYPKRDYDTFSLPAGRYQSLRVIIGEGVGKNWWCVVFPSLCMPAAGADFRDTAASSGFSDGLSDALTGEPEGEVRFFLLDCLGKLEKIFSKE